MHAVEYKIRLLEPVIATSVEGEPNSRVSLPYVPGSAVRGVAVAAFLRRNGILDAADENARRLFLDGRTCWLNAYQADKNGTRTLPVPRSFFGIKNKLDAAYDFSTEGEPFPTDVAEEPDAPVQWKGIDGFTCTIDDDRIYILSPERRLAVHINRDRAKGRPHEGEGAIFRYEPLEAQQVFAGAVMCDSESDTEIVKDLLAGEAQFGGARSVDYGHAEFFEVKPGSRQWNETPHRAQNGDKLVITLLSDAILRTPSGQNVTDGEGLSNYLSTLTGLPLTHLHAFCATTTVGGFNRKWNLPLPQETAVKAGSVVVFQHSQDLEHALRALTARGIGERRAEGFGRIAVNWHGAKDKLSMDSGRPYEDRVDGRLTDDTARALARDMVRRLVRRRLDRHLYERARRLGENLAENRTKPSRTQLSRVANIVRDTLLQDSDSGTARLRALFNDLAKRNATSKQFSKARVGGNSLDKWLHARLDDDGDDIKHELAWSSITLKLGDVEPEFPPDMVYEYNLRLIYEMLTAARKRHQLEVQS